MVGTEKLLATGHLTSCCPAYISGRQPVSPPLASKILEEADVEEEQKNIKNTTKEKKRSRISCRGALRHCVITVSTHVRHTTIIRREDHLQLHVGKRTQRISEQPVREPFQYHNSCYATRIFEGKRSGKNLRI